MVPCWNTAATRDKDVLNVVLMKIPFICMIKHNMCYYSYTACKERRTIWCYLLRCHECKNADKSLSSSWKNSDVLVLVKTAVKQRGQWGRTLSSYFQFWPCNNIRWHWALPPICLSSSLAVLCSCRAGWRALCSASMCLRGRASSWLLVHPGLPRYTQGFCGPNSSSLRQ